MAEATPSQEELAGSAAGDTLVLNAADPAVSESDGGVMDGAHSGSADAVGSEPAKKAADEEANGAMSDDGGQELGSGDHATDSATVAVEEAEATTGVDDEVDVNADVKDDAAVTAAAEDEPEMAAVAENKAEMTADAAENEPSVAAAAENEPPVLTTKETEEESADADAVTASGVPAVKNAEPSANSTASEVDRAQASAESPAETIVPESDPTVESTEAADAETSLNSSAEAALATKPHQTDVMPVASPKIVVEISENDQDVSKDSSAEDAWEGRGDADDYEHEEVDPRVEIALQDMNDASDAINRLEKELEETKAAFKTAMDQVQIDLRDLANKLGRRNIDKARPYHQALFRARKAHYESRQAAVYFEKASGAYQQAKQKVKATEQQLEKGATFDANLQASLNKATQDLMTAFNRKEHADTIHQTKTQTFLKADRELMELAKARKKIIIKTKPYYESKVQHDKILMGLRQQLLQQERDIKAAKEKYSNSLNTLSSISEEIHERREAEKAAKTPPASATTQHGGASVPAETAVSEATAANSTAAPEGDKSSRTSVTSSPRRVSSEASDRLRKQIEEAKAQEALQLQREQAREKDREQLLAAEQAMNADLMAEGGEGEENDYNEADETQDSIVSSQDDLHMANVYEEDDAKQSPTPPSSAGVDPVSQ
ncbi:uncharacterized protein MONBRDRAFT_26563 [Monosiga brevicollis MX1]|uniref:SH3 domain-binding protein 5 n=1 Tax=Monosiga brevicollis TaxID=81824 RepID=A9V2Q9_MONBE|nr:uncharacterized protein MONBRDRAFT_26563 [Monosiga brevicollis MX1]EDQ88305.1 predicted protein [Monosiga brevicollis MX1]|eukprot:XP_001746898.1 hypothetical protein [Monosiga brevicollis MX1]